jgi:hypothetical protein
MGGSFSWRRSPPLRYYLYISQSKLDVLIPQLPESRLRALTADIRINMGVVAAGVAKPATAASPELSAKAGVLTDYLEKQQGWVGSLADPGRYVRDIASLRHGVMRDYAADLAVFAGVVNGLKLALIGSPASLIGAAADTEANHSVDYYLLRFLSDAAESLPSEEDLSQDDRQRFGHAIDRALSVGLSLPAKLNLEFLAKPLFRSDGMLVATPIWVALAE